MAKISWTILLSSVLVLACLSSASATPAKIVSGVVSNVVSVVFKWIWSLKSTPKTAVNPSRSMMKFEGGYSVETVFDGSKLGIEPFAVDVSPNGDIFILDSENSNIYKISSSLSLHSRPKLVAGSAEGYNGHVDGKLREARMNNPKGLTFDDKGNIYVADSMNMAIRKISDTGVVTIAGGGKWGQGGGHVDGPSDEAKFSNDFDVVYVSTTCSLLVIDRGNQAIREIQLRDDDCSHKSSDDIPLGLAVLAASAFFGYMLALLQRRISSMFSSTSNLSNNNLDPRAAMKNMPQPPYQRPHQSVRPPLIPQVDESNQYEDDGMFGSIGKCILKAIGLSGSKSKPIHNEPNTYMRAWPTQESFMIPESDEPPPIERTDPTPRRLYPNELAEPIRNFKKSRPFYDQHHRNVQPYQQQQQQQRNYSSGPQTFYEQKCETNEIVFGAVQEQDGRREAVVIKAVDYGSEPINYSNGNFRSRYNYSGYSYGY